MDPQTTFSLAKYLDFAKEASFSSWNNIRHIREHDSTQDYCKKAIKEGEGKGLLVVCDKQLHGRGRSGNHWLSASGESLTFSVVLDKISSYPDYLPLLLGLACLKAVQQCLESEPSVAASKLPPSGRLGLKWPNDLCFEDASGELHKWGGILCESNQSKATQSSGLVIAGIGINLKQNSFHGDFKLPPTSLGLLGIQLSPEKLLVAIGIEWEKIQSDSHSLKHLAELASFDLLYDRLITVVGASRPLRGRAVGISSERSNTALPLGSLALLEDGNKDPTAVRTGQIYLSAKP